MSYRQPRTIHHRLTKIMGPRATGLIHTAAYCMSTLWWSLSLIGTAHGQVGFSPTTAATESIRTANSAFATPLPTGAEKSRIPPTPDFFQSARPFPVVEATGRDSLNHGLISNLPEATQLTEYVAYSANATMPWSLHQPSIPGYQGQGDLRDAVQRFLIMTGGSYPMMPLEVNRHVKRILDYYQHDIHNRFQRYLDRFEKYKDLVQGVFKEARLPTELGYLSLVESGFNPLAFSRARASGPWQFMKATGSDYGLDVTWYVDERRDPVKSTKAAAQHLKDLYDLFQSWPLALAAYNAGAGKIKRAIRKSGSRDFWKIRQTRYIRRETKDYVPSFIAAVLIASNPTQYGFKVNTAIPYAFDKVLMYKRAHLKAVATTTGISIKRLKSLNPELLQTIVPLMSDGYPLKVPIGKGLVVRERHDQIEMWTKLPPASATWYQVRFGDTLDDVARQFGVTKEELKRLNGLKDNVIRWNDRLRLRNDDDSALAPLKVEPAAPVTWYRVHFGDTLDSVAKEFDLTVAELKRINKLEDDIIRWNDRIRVRAEEDDNPSLVPKSEPAPPATWYTVHFGDTLEDVAKEFDLSVAELKRLNNLTDNIIRWNDRLRIRAEKDESPVALKPEQDKP